MENPARIPQTNLNSPVIGARVVPNNNARTLEALFLAESS